ncbi:MAG: hypothetical protein R6V35_00880 [Candidatus Nanohaloarchaea archaeon]
MPEKLVESYLHLKTLNFHNLKEVDSIKPNFQDFEVELEALQTTSTEKDRVEKHIETKTDINQKEIEPIQNRI